jgi:hypothetical protein
VNEPGAGLRRRALLGGGLALVGAAAVAGLVDTGVLPGKGHVERAFGDVPGSTVDAAIPRATPGTVVSGSFRSARVGRSVGYRLCYPPGPPRADPLPGALALPGRAMTAADLVQQIGYDRWLASWVDGGGAPYVIAAVDGGTDYWHPRAGGVDPLGMLTTELIPVLARRGLPTSRIGALGVSMGAYGSLLLARQSARAQLGDTRVVVAAATSAALWVSAGATAPGAFDDAADWQRWGDLVADPGLATSTAVWVACGDSDPFAAADRAYRAAAGVTAGGFSPGAHDPGYWRSVAAAQVAFVGAHLG